MLLLLACAARVPLATVAPTGELPLLRPDQTPAERGVTIASAAGAFLGASRLEVEGRTYRWDCSGLVEATFARVGLDWRGSTADLYAAAKAEHVLVRGRRPRPGDLAYFDDTYDRNSNGRLDDDLSHVAIVRRVEDDGTAVLIHLGSKGVTEIRMDLRRRVHVDADGVVRNDYLRARRPGDRRRTRYLSAELWRAFGRFARLPVPEAPTPPEPAP